VDDQRSCYEYRSDAVENSTCNTGQQTGEALGSGARIWLREPVDLLRSYIVNENQLRAILEIAREGRNIEFKGAMPWSNPEFRAKITKSILAFSNVRDGGAIIIGVEEPSDGVFNFVGVETQTVKTFSEEDVAAHVAEYADPYTKSKGSTLDS
jgi:hypothetical protein